MAEEITIRHLRVVVDYVSQHGAVTNRECRGATELGYDSAIRLFAAMCAVGILEKTGEASGTKYILSHQRKAKDNSMKDQITVNHLSAVLDYVAKEGTITNREFRELTGLSYNSAIRVFGALCSLGMLKKTGVSSTTKYSVPNRFTSSNPPRPGFHRKNYL